MYRSLPAIVFLAITSLICALPAAAHDTWVQTNTNVVRVGDAVHIDLLLGNHGNDHRDFKMASKIDPEDCVLRLIMPDGRKFDLKDRLADLGYAPKEGYWSAKFVGAQSGLYLVEHTLDRVVNHGRPVRSIKSAKTCFVLSPTLDRVSENNPGFDRILGHSLELVPESNPVTPMGPEQPITVRLYYKGKPLADERVSFIPRGEELKEGFDKRYERKTDSQGLASFTPKTGNYYLVVAHVSAPEEKALEYDRTHDSATLTVFVPEICPCCRGEE